MWDSDGAVWSHRIRPTMCPLLLGLLFLSCGEDVVATAVPIPFGDACREGEQCAGQLACIESICQPAGDAGENETCVVSGDCGAGLACALRTCTPAGSGEAGAPCADTVDCAAGLRCSGSSGVAVCAAAGSAFKGDRCSASDECQAGLVCDGARASCQSEFSAPFGIPCSGDIDCAPESGLVCLAEGRCGGLGPDGEALALWDGVECPDFSTLEGDFRVHFERSAGDFYRMPFPNDVRRTASGVDLAGYPMPPASTTAGQATERLVNAAESDPLGFALGFGPHQTVFMRFSGPPVFCGSGCGESEPPANEAGCMGANEPEPTVFVVDLTRNGGGDFFGFSTGLAFFWRASTASQPYLCGPWIGVRPEFNSDAPTLSDTWKPGHTYAVFVHSRVRGCDGETRVTSVRDPNLDALLSSTAPSDSPAAEDWAAYAPLREWLETAPTYPAGGTVLSSDLLGASVFTVRDPSETGRRVAAQTLSIGATTVENVVSCAGDSAPDDCSDDPEFTEYRGQLSLPNFQAGTAPYLETGGGIVLEQGGPVADGEIAVAFALTVPTATAPDDGWPVVIYAHGTGGSERSHIVDGTAELLSSVAAVIGIEQVGHGSRRGTVSVDPEFLVFNVLNPVATRGNQLQALADQVALSVALDDIATVVSVPLNSSQVAWLGHSQGGNAVALAASSVPTTTVSVLSGAGGVLLETLKGKTEPYDSLSLLQATLLDRTLTDTFFHPVLDLLQGYYEEGDPANYAPTFARELPDGFEAKHVLHLVGIGDSFTPNGAGLALARGLGGVFANTVGSDLPTANEIIGIDYPLSDTLGMRTVVTSLHNPNGDGHFVLFEADGLAARRVQSFFAEWVANGIPTVVEQ